MINKLYKRIRCLVEVPPLEALQYLFCKLNSKIISRYLKRSGSKLYISLGSTIRGGKYIEIGRNFYAGRGFWIECVGTYHNKKHCPKITIGDNCSVSNYVHITACCDISIGANVLIGSKVLITDHSHGQYSGDEQSSPATAPALRPLFAKGSNITIEDNVWLCDNVVILSGVKIGHGTIVSANSVVSDNVPSFCIVGGTPAKVLRRFDCKSNAWRKPEVAASMRQ